MERSRNSLQGEASSSVKTWTDCEKVNDNGTKWQYYLKVTELPPQISEQELRHFFQDPKQFTGRPIEVDWNPQTQMAVIFFSDPDDVLRAVKQSPLVINGKRICVEMGSTLCQKEPQEKVRTVKVKGLQADDIQLCLLNVENPKKGGGEIQEHRWDEEKKTLYITFTDAKVAEHLTNSSPSISGKTLDVALHNPQSEEDNFDHSDQCTVEVRGFDPSKVQVYEMYFQNPNKGGGDIANLVVNENNTVMYVTFQTHEVAERVAMRSHTVSGLELRVKLAPKTSTVMVTNCDVKKEDLYKVYFENPKYGGGDIKEMSMDRALKIIYITFEDSKVAQQVAASSHRISGLELQVRLAPPTSTVMVTNCDVENEDLCKMYFENPKYGGGDIQEIIVDKEHRAIYITFEDPEFAAAVCARHHTMNGQELEVKLHRIKPSGQKLKVSSAPEEKEETTLTGTIEVTVGNQLQSDETYLYYFEYKRYGEGEVKKLESDKEKGLIHVTFVHHEVNRQHTINGQTVDVKLYIPAKPRPNYKNRLLLENVKKTNDDSLLLFIEYVTGCEPAEVMYGEIPGVVLATFTEELDFTKAEEKCRVRTLAGNRVSVSKVPISNCLLVENLNPVTTEDTLAMYFENIKRSLGGPVERVEMVTGENKCLIYFANHTVIDGILTKTHTIDHSTLTLKHYFECLGPSGGSLDENIFILPKPISMKDIDPCKIAFVSQSSKAQNDLMHLLSRCHAVPKFTENTVTVECTLKPSDSNARTLAKTWPQDVLQEVNKYLDLDVHRLEILLPENWVEVEKSVNSISLENKDDAIFFVQPQDRVVVVVGFESMAKNVFQQVSRTVKIVEDEVNRKSKAIKETKGVKSLQLRLLDAMSFQTEAERKHNGVKVEICLKKGEITFQGMLKDVREAQIAMFNISKSIKSDTITEMSTLQEDLLNTKETCEFIVDALKSEKITAVWEHVQKAVIVYAFNDADLEKAVHIIRTSVVQHIHPLTTESTQLLHSLDWLTLEQTLLDAHAGKLKIIPSLDIKQIVITGTSDILNEVLLEVQKFMQDNAVYTEVYSFSPSRQKFIILFWKEKILSLANALKAYKVQVTIDKDGEGICVRSTEKGLQMAKAKLKELGEKVLCHVETVVEPTKVKFLSSDSCAKELDHTEHICRCVVGFKEECTDLQMVLSSGQKGRNAAEVFSVMKTVLRVNIAKSVTVSVVHGDITRLSVDVLVNAANSRMDHHRGLAKHIVDIGGKYIQEESHRILRSIGPELPEGEVLMTGAGQLPCKAIIHAVGPMYRGGRMRERQRLFGTVMTCLETTLKFGYTSIAIPALGTGIFNYPVDESTSVVVETVRTYIGKHRMNTIREIYLCGIDLDTIGHFRKALQTVNTERSSKTLSIPSFESGYAAEVKTSTLYVYAASESNIKAFLAAFGELVNDTFTSKEISDEALSWISEDQIKEFKRDAKQFNVDIQIHPLDYRLVMVGLRSNVFELTQKISQSLRQEHRTKQEDETASVLVNMVQWCFTEVSKTGTKLKEYGGRQNNKIETAYQNKEKTVEIKDIDGNVYVIDFDLMKEYSQNNPSDQVDVIRKDKIKAGIDGSDIPKYWTPLNPGEHVKLVQLKPTDSEYQTVEKNFRSTLGPDGSKLMITVIERVQNPILYRQYQAKKAQLEKQNISIQNEKIMWHGTSVEAISNINNYGFNRSYCGKNATFYGEGVYFAVTSQYSASPTYSPPDPNTGKRYIYLCMVLTGYATEGDKTLRFLPPRSGPILFDSATDNIDSPAMFVIFNDTQAYPGYLITFQ